MKKVWSDAETQFIKDNADSMSDVQIADTLNRFTTHKVTTFMVGDYRRKLGLKKAEGRHSGRNRLLRENKQKSVPSSSAHDSEANASFKDEVLPAWLRTGLV